MVVVSISLCARKGANIVPAIAAGTNVIEALIAIWQVVVDLKV